MPSFSVLHHLGHGWTATSSAAPPPITAGALFSIYAIWLGGAGAYTGVTATSSGGLDTRRLIRSRVNRILIHDVRM